MPRPGVQGDHGLRNIWLVIKHDVGVTVRQRSFWIFTLLVPALLLAVNAYSIIQRGGLSSTDQDADSQEATSGSLADLSGIGLVDEAGLIAEMPPGFPPDLFVRFPDEAAARAAVEAGEIPQYVYLPADYVASGEITVYDQGFQLFSTGENMGVAFASNQADTALRHQLQPGRR